MDSSAAPDSTAPPAEPPARSRLHGYFLGVVGVAWYVVTTLVKGLALSLSLSAAWLGDKAWALAEGLLKVIGYFVGPWLLLAAAILPQVANVLHTTHMLSKAMVTYPGLDYQPFVDSSWVRFRIWSCFAISIALELYWVIAAATCVFRAAFTARWYRAKSAPPTSKTWYRTDGKGLEHALRRICEICGIYMADRMEHARSSLLWGPTIDTCLQGMDHICEFIGGPLWAANAKAYFHMQIGLILHSIFILAVGFEALSKEWYRTAFPYGWVGSLTIFVMLLAIYCLAVVVWQWFYLGLTQKEYHKDCLYLRSAAGQVEEFEPPNSPWKRGWIDNFQLVMGTGWDWLLIWKPSPLMDVSRECPTRLQPPPSNENQSSPVPDPSNDPGRQTSSGVDEVELAVMPLPSAATLRQRRTDST